MKENIDVSGMRPQKGQTKIVLPVTFDYSGGRKDSQKMCKIWSVILLVISIIISLGIIFNKKGYVILNVPLGILVFYTSTFLIRFLLLKEGKVRQQEILLEESDYKRTSKDFWGIYTIDEAFPHYCRFRSGKSGLFIRLNKDVILGKYSEAEYEHDEAIGDAYNICGSSNIQMCHVDYMDNIGTDERLVESFASMGKVTNPEVKDILTDIFAYQQKRMEERVTTFDVYMFMWTGSDINAWNTIQRILSCFMQANYRSYHVLSDSDLRELTKVLMNLEDFSTISAMLNAFSSESSVGVVPISLQKSDGSVEKLGKTQKEIQKENEEKEKELNKKKSKSTSKPKEYLEADEEIEI